MKTKLLTTIFMFITAFAFSQNEKCGTMLNWERIKAKDPNAELRMQQLEDYTRNWIQNKSVTGTIITIPVVVHVIYNANEENISDDQIQSQIDIINDDFRLLNSDSLDDNHPFWQFTADAEIEFCLAQQDPGGNPTDGITRTYTDSTSFIGEGYEKYSSTGGEDNWDPTKYLNLWVCNLDGSDGTLGYAAFPSELSTNPGDDGVVIRYEAFGDIGTAGTGIFNANDLGRTATHEIGHWLNLSHIWGDESCGDDFVSDTPPQEGAEGNSGCPSFPHNPNNSCGADGNGEMYMNYMDYVDDACMVMFTQGQADRMNAALNGPRAGLLNSIGCETVSIDENVLFTKSIQVFPNPASNQFNVSSNSGLIKGVDIIDALGRVVAKHSANTTSVIINTTSLNSGLYTLRVWNDENVGYKNIVLL